MGKIHYNLPVLAIVTGVPGSGKTVLSLGLFDDLGNKLHNGVLDLVQATYIDKDMINDGFTKERAGEFYDAVRSGTYKAIDNLVLTNLRLGNSIWIDATYSTEVQDPSWADRYFEMTQETDLRLRLIRCTATEQIIKQQLKDRGYERDYEKLENWEAFMQREPIHVAIPYGGIEVDRTNNLEENIKTVLQFFKE